jgi:virulence-associated protein VapD
MNMLTELFNRWREANTGWSIQIISSKQFRLVKKKGERHNCEWSDGKLYIDKIYISDVTEPVEIMEILRKNLSL